MPEFNLKQYLKKNASYEGAKGYFHSQTRAWCNCWKSKLDDGKDPNAAWEECLGEYQKGGNNADWAEKYAGRQGMSKTAESSEKYDEEISKGLESGKSFQQSLREALSSSLKKSEIKKGVFPLFIEK